MELNKKRSGKYWILVIVVLIIAVGAYYLFLRPASKSVTVKKTVNPWEETINKQFTDAKQVDPTEQVKELNSEIFPIIKDTVKAEVKLTQSDDKKLIYVAKTIIVEGDVDTIKKALEGKGYKDIKVTNNYKNLSAKKDDKEVKFTFSVDTTDKSNIEVTL